MLEVRELSKSFGGLKAVDQASLDVRQGEIVGLIGPNGAGKTTLFAAIAGFHTPDAGHVAFEGKDITGLAPHRICAAGIGRVEAGDGREQRRLAGAIGANQADDLALSDIK